MLYVCRRILKENDLLVQQMSQANLERRSVEEQLQKLRTQSSDKDKQLEQLKKQLKFLVITKTPQAIGGVKDTSSSPLTCLKVEAKNRPLSMVSEGRDNSVLHSLPPKYYPSVIHYSLHSLTHFYL